MQYTHPLQGGCKLPQPRYDILAHHRLEDLDGLPAYVYGL